MKPREAEEIASNEFPNTELSSFTLETGVSLLDASDQ